MMKMKWAFVSAVAAIVMLQLSCAKAPKKDEAAEGAPEAQVSAEPLSFDVGGSDSGKIPGLNTVNFDYDQSTLSAEARRLLAENAEWIRKNPGVTVEIEGHCDNRGSTEYNLALGERRAKTVKTYLVSLGVSEGQLATVSYGEEKPMAYGDTEQDHARNRRANFVPKK